MKKMMFNDKYGLTQAVLEGRKTMTRRIIPQEVANKFIIPGDGVFPDCPCEGLMKHSRYKLGEVVAVAQAYKDVYSHRDFVLKDCSDGYIKESPGWTNKMFVRAYLMPHHIRITNVRVERLQDISDEDCFKEGIYKKTLCPPGDIDYFYHSEPTSKWEVYPSAREAFATLIDKVSGKGTWASNPWVFVYEFELVK